MKPRTLRLAILTTIIVLVTVLTQTRTSDVFQPMTHGAGQSKPVASVQALPVVTVTITNFAFSPNIQAVAQGNPITWVNSDPVSHTLWFTNQVDNSTIGFSDPISPGGAWTGSFSSVSRIKYYDFNMLWITGSLVVSFSPGLFRFDWSDWNNDNKVTILDVAQAAFCFDRTSGSTIWATCKYWDFYLENRITILDIALVAFFFDQTSSASPYPAQGQTQGQMDPIWKYSCSTLTSPDLNYCNTLT